jgi:hypothetical protein
VHSTMRRNGTGMSLRAGYPTYDGNRGRRFSVITHAS